MMSKLRRWYGKRQAVLTAIIVLGVAVALFAPSTPRGSAREAQPEQTRVQLTFPTDHPLIEGGPYAVADVVEAVGPAVVFIQVEYRAEQRSRMPGLIFPNDPFRFPSEWFWPFPQPGPRSGSGSGFIIAEEGYVLTNQHLFSRPDLIESIRVTLPDREEPIEAALVGSDFDLDLAVLKLEGDGPFPAVPMGDSDQVRVGEWVIAIGNPYEFEHTVTVGVLSATGRQIQITDREEGRIRRYSNLMQTDAAINPGNSGGPLLNLRGEVVGINTAVSTRGQGIGFAIPINEARKVLDDLINRGMVVRPFIGIRYISVDPAAVEQLDLGVDRGILIVDVVPDTAAQRAGLRVYDVITKVGRTEINDTEDFLKAIEGMQVGDVLMLTVVRDGREMAVRLEVGERPQGL